ncbi:MAG TPA: peptidylprolyl isomerase, partial [Paludibacter sp.]|nr:peptidylprolyl isomerase [Paludibacter sp.]
MKRSVISLVASVAFSAGIFAQAADPVLMTISGKPVYKSEFEYIYNKNNSNNSLDKKTLDEYVDLFINFKLKVEEAKAQGIDTTSSFVNELAGYRSQLTKPYLTDQQVDEQILKEAYDRMKEDVDVSHILIRIAPNATPADTLKAWSQINDIAKRLKKEDFAKVAKEVSQDQSAEKNGGHIGWISAFRTIYPFETVAYNTPKGAVSKPVRTAFGYHIIKVHDRRNSLGEILVSHIMRFTSQGDSAANVAAKLTIDSIYNRVQAGDDFGTLAKQHSMDKGSSVKNGELPWFGTGRMVPEFETAAFALKNIGEVSAPVRSAYGWHIIKLLDRKGVDTYENVKAEIE